MKHIYFIIIMISVASCGISQPLVEANSDQSLPYAEIENYPSSYSSGNIIGRMIDGLGYRYYWGTDSLRITDLSYSISQDSRSVEFTLEHLYGLSKFILSVIYDDPNIRARKEEELAWEDKRKKTLDNFKKASNKVKGMTDEEISNLKIVFTRGEKVTELPMWHLINGPIADAIYHVGQIVSFRRASGNPLNPSVNVFMGKNRD